MSWLYSVPERNIENSWCEIDLSQMLTNIHKVYEVCPSHTKLMAVVKDNAYGHGAVAVSLYLQSRGVSNFAVANITEAIELRKAGINGDILILGYTPIFLTEELAEFNLIQTVTSVDHADKLANCGRNIRCHFSVDTGMRRIGINSDDIEYCINLIIRYSDILNIEGIFTHLSVADSSQNESDVIFTEKQIKDVKKIYEGVKGKVKYVHFLNSAGGMYIGYYGGDFLRFGVSLYGIRPNPNADLLLGMNPILTWKTRISMVKDIHKGDNIGYGRTFTAPKNMKIATVNVGYANGYDRRLSNCGVTIVNNCIANVVGRICMDQMMIDVSNLVDVNVEDEVILAGCDTFSISHDVSIDGIAKRIGTIGHEVVCGIPKETPRYYHD